MGRASVAQDKILTCLRNQETGLSMAKLEELAALVSKALEDDTQFGGAAEQVVVEAIESAIESPIVQLVLAQKGSSIKDVSQSIVRVLVAHVTEDPRTAIPAEYSSEAHCPYPGLTAFLEAEAELFCGREAEIETFLASISRPVLALTGPSGVGKSSFINAGVMPRLRVKYGDKGKYLTYRVNASDDLLGDFAAFMSGVTNKDASRIQQAIEERDDALVQTLETILDHEHNYLVLVIDQFEALFVGEEAERKGHRQRLLDNLILVEKQDWQGHVLVVLVSRENYFEHPDYVDRPRLRELIQRENLALYPLTDKGLREAIEKPLARFNKAYGQELRFEKGLVNLIIQAFRNPAISLPLVQYLLWLLWTEKRQLTHFAYNSLGGLDRALDRHATEIYQGFNEGEQPLVKFVLLSMVRPGLSNEYTRKRIRRATLLAFRDSDHKQQLESILHRLSDERSRIISEQKIGDTAYLELTHEVILRQWSFLQALIEVQKQQLVERERLLPKAELWQRSVEQHPPRGDAGYLYQRSELKSVRRYLEQQSGETRDILIGECYRKSQRYQRRILVRNGAIAIGLTVLVFLAFVWFQDQANRRLAEEQERGDRNATAQAQAELQQATTEASRATAAAQAEFEAAERVIAVAEAATAEALQAASDAAAATAETQSEIEALQRATAEAEEAYQSSISEASSLASQALNEIESNPENALLHAIQSVYATYETYGTVAPEADLALSRVLFTYKFIDKFYAYSSLAALYNPQGTQILSYGGTEAYLWDTGGNLQATLQGHNDAVTSALYSPNGLLVATASNDNSVRLWTSDGTLIGTIDQFSEEPSIIGFTQDNTAVLVTSNDGTVGLWDLNGKLLFSVANFAVSERAIGFDSVGERIAMVTNEGKVNLLNSQGGLAASISSPTGSIESVAFGTDASEIITLNNNQIIEVWSIDGSLNLEITANMPINYALLSSNSERIIGVGEGFVGVWDKTGQQINVIRGSFGSVVLSKDGSQIATTSGDNTAKLWSMEGELLISFEHEFELGRDRSHFVYTADFSPDGSKLITMNMFGEIYVWQVANGIVSSFKGHQLPIRASDIHPNGELYATAGDDQTVNICRNNQLVASLQGHSDQIQSLNFSPDGTIVATASHDGTARLWDTTTWTEITTLQGHTDWVFMANFSPDGKYIVTASRDGTARVWNLDGSEVSVLRGHDGPVMSAEFSPSSDTIVTSGADYSGKIWRLDGSLLYSFSGEDNDYLVGMSAHFNPDGDRIVTACGLDCDNGAIWTKQGDLLTILEGHTYWVFSAYFDPTGEKIVTSSRDGTAIIWDLDGQIIKRLEGHSSWVTWSGFDPTGSRIATFGLDGTIHLWNSSGELIVVLPGHDGAVNTASFSDDGRFLVTGGDDGYVKLWQIYTNVDLMIKDAIRHLLSFMTIEECAMHFGDAACSQ